MASVSTKFRDNNSAVFSFLKYEKLTDVTLTCDRKMIKAHKIILAASSKYFEEVFELLEDKHPVVVLKDIKIKYLLLILEYVYLGTVDLQNEDIAGFKDVAKNLQIDVEINEMSEQEMSQDMLTEVSTTDQDMVTSYNDDTMDPGSLENVMEYSVAATKLPATGRRLENSDEHNKGPPPPKKLRRASTQISTTSSAVSLKSSTTKKVPAPSADTTKRSVCIYCDRAMRERDRNYHQKFCWDNANRIASDCSHCVKRFSVPGKLRLHMNITHPEIDF